jgi:uncharacterized protein DUF1566
MPQHERRNSFILRLLAVGFLAGAALTASLAQADSGVGPYFPEPAMDRKLPASLRFYVLTDWNNEAVLDKETGLVWERTPTIGIQWESARIFCAGRTTGSRKGWRLPSLHELNSLFDPSAVLPGSPNPALPVGHPFHNFVPAPYWSATLDAANPNAAWMVDFNSGGGVSTDLIIDGHGVLCVRGASNAHQY